jgi:hypothetical protein
MDAEGLMLKAIIEGWRFLDFEGRAGVSNAGGLPSGGGAHAF